MNLTPEESAALGLWREGMATEDEVQLIGDCLMRHFPVRKIGDVVIRWDDPVTPERLMDCGWKRGSASIGCAGMQVYPLDGIWWNNGCVVPEMMKPETMLDIWILMERAGVTIPGEVM